MAARNTKKEPKKDFDKKAMFAKIMPSYGGFEQEDDEAQQMLQARQNATRFTLRNYLEDVVVSRLDATIQALGGCNCDRCRKDVLAMVLNTLPSYYQAVENESVEHFVRALHAKMNPQVSAALVQAVQQVKARPNH